MLLVDFTELSYKQSNAVAKLMRVYADNFAGETFHIAQNETSGCVYLSLDCLPICPFVNGSGDVFFEVFDFESGDIEEFSTIEEAEDHAAELHRIQMEEMEY